MGSSTNIVMHNFGKFNNNIQNKKNPIKILHRNKPPKVRKCVNCKKNDGVFLENGFVKCEKCVEEKECALEIVNSPRTGICGYE